MRWFWIDRFIEFESGRRAVAIKAVSLVEEELDDYSPSYPMMPHSLVIEGIAQTGGLLAGEHYAFEQRVVLAKVSSARFHCVARPGEILRYTAEMHDNSEHAASVRATSHIGDRLHAEVDLLFAHLKDRVDERELFDPADFLRMLRAFGLFDVGRKSDGSPIAIPPRLLSAEQADDAQHA
jgi:3-hydroxyacyl-[acyl-carrier-protein] dehydratase